MDQQKKVFIVHLGLIFSSFFIVIVLFIIDATKENNFKSSEINFVKLEPSNTKDIFHKPAKAVFESKEQREYFTVELTQYEFEHFPLDEGETIKTIDNEDYILIFDKKKELNIYN